jgi:hypothetical protein
MTTGIAISSDIRPLNNANFGVVKDTYLERGFRAVDDATARDALTLEVTPEGSFVWVKDVALLYRRNSAGAWVEFIAGNVSEYRKVIDVSTLAPDGHPRDGTVDWSPYIQQAIDLAIAPVGAPTNETGIVYIPPGRYRIDTTLKAFIRNGNEYTFSSVKIEGCCPSYNNNFNSTVLISPSNANPILVYQKSRDISLENIVFVGSSGWATGIDANQGMVAIYNNPATDYTGGCRDNPKSPYAGVVIDPFSVYTPVNDRYPGLTAYYTNTDGGSSLTRIHRCHFEKFVVGLSLSPNGSTQNNDSVSCIDCSWENCKVAISVGQSQSRDTHAIRPIIHQCKVCFDSVNYGEGLGEPVDVQGGRTTFCGEIYQSTRSYGGQLRCAGLYNEGLYRIGTFSGAGPNEPITFDTCSFNFDPTPSGERRPDRLITNANVTLRDCYLFVNAATVEPILVTKANGGILNLVGGFVFSSITDHAPHFWINGYSRFPAFIRMRDFTVQDTPRASVLNPRGVLSTWDADVAQDVWPGTILETRLGTIPLRGVDSRDVLVYVGELQMTVTDNVGAIVVDPAKVQVGDLLWSARVFTPSAGVDTECVVGKVLSINGVNAVVNFIPTYFTNDPAPVSYYVAKLPRIHRATTGGTVSSSTVLEGVTQPQDWRVGDYIQGRTGGGAERIPTNTRITAIDVGLGTITLSHAVTTHPSGTLNLYSANMFEFTTTQVP